MMIIKTGQALAAQVCRIDSKEIKYLRESFRDGDVRLQGKAHDSLIHIAKTAKVTDSKTYEAVMLMDGIDSTVNLALASNKSYIAFKYGSREKLRQRLVEMKDYLAENPGMVDGTIAQVEYIIRNMGNGAPEFRDPLVYERPPIGTIPRATLDNLEKELLKSSAIDLDFTKEALKEFITAVFFIFP
ncbi:MAG: hypothetical protein ACREBF_01710 [Candidatus Micrarchaeales archaeon]